MSDPTEGNAPPAIPSNSPSAAASDPGAPTNVMPAPTPGAPTAGTDNILTMVVPTDSTVLQMGASACGPDLGVAAISGFRVSTATHAHITAQSPATTISLGAAGGMGMGGVAGLSLYTEGQKDERVTLAAAHSYEDVLSIKSGKARTDTVESGGMTEEVKGGYKQTIEGGVGYDQSIAPKWHTKVEGPWNFEVSDKVTWKAEKDVDITCKGWKVTNEQELEWTNLGNIKHTHMVNKLEFTFGTTTGMFVGIKTEMMVGGEISVFAGAKLEIEAAISQEIGTAGSELHAMKHELKGLANEMDGVNTSLKGLRKTTIALANSSTGLRQSTVGLDDVEAGLKMTTAGINMMD